MIRPPCPHCKTEGGNHHAPACPFVRIIVPLGYCVTAWPTQPPCEPDEHTFLTPRGDAITTRRCMHCGLSYCRHTLEKA